MWKLARGWLFWPAGRGNLAGYLRSGADVHTVAHDDADRRSVESIVTASDFNLVIDIAVPPDFHTGMNSDAPSVMPEPRSGADYALGRQQAVEENIIDNLNQARHQGYTMKSIPPRHRMKFQDHTASNSGTRTA